MAGGAATPIVTGIANELRATRDLLAAPAAGGPASFSG